MRNHSGPFGLWLLASVFTTEVLAAKPLPRPLVTSPHMTNAILEGFRKGSLPPAQTETGAPAESAEAVPGEKIVLPKMQINTRRPPTEREVTVIKPPKPVLGTGVKEYRNGTIKVRSILFIPVCISIDW